MTINEVRLSIEKSEQKSLVKVTIPFSYADKTKSKCECTEGNLKISPKRKFGLNRQPRLWLVI